MPRKINLKQPVYIDGKEASIVWISKHGIFAVEMPAENTLRQFNQYGRPLDGNLEYAVNIAPETTEIVVIYPHGDVYVSARPYKDSMYGIDQLIQIRVTKRGGKIVRKELIQ
jgi:hypothetical protein